MLTNVFHEFMDLNTNNSLGSDHLPVSFSVKIGSKLKIPEHFIYSYKKANWKKFREIIDKNLSISNLKPEYIVSIQQIDTLLDHFGKTLNSAISQSIPQVKPYNSEFELSDEIKALIIVRNTLRHQWQRDRLPSLKNSVNTLQRQMAFKINELRNVMFSGKLQKFQTNDPNMWSISKFLKNINRSFPPFSHENNIL
jgi:hypothetical protein